MNAIRTPVAGFDAAVRPPALDVERLRGDFPILARRVNGKPLVYLDNAATTQKPRAVIDALCRYYSADNANIHRGIHTLSVRATDAYEQARRDVQQFIGATLPEEVIFVRGATEGINLVAQAYGRNSLRTGDEIVISEMEHHSNIVPWQVVCEQTGARLRVAPIHDSGELLLDEYERLLSTKTRLVALTYVSNALGTINPIRRMIELAHECGALVLVDAAQAVPHMKIDVREMDCDFLVFSGHKLYGPTGIGVVYGKAALLDRMPPYQSGGDMISSVTFEKTVYNRLPYKFEAGTPHIAGAIGLGAAIEYLNTIGLDRIAAYEGELLCDAAGKLAAVPGVRLIGTAKKKAAVLSFIVEGIHPHDIGTVLDHEGVAIRTGHHCAQPLMDRYGVPATARASYAFYNTKEETDRLVAGLRKAIEVLG